MDADHPNQPVIRQVPDHPEQWCYIEDLVFSVAGRLGIQVAIPMAGYRMAAFPNRCKIVLSAIDKTTR